MKVIDLAESRKTEGHRGRSATKKWGQGQKERKKMLESLVTDYGLGRMVQAPRANQVWWQLT